MILISWNRTCSSQSRKAFGVDEQDNAACLARDALDEALAGEVYEHLMNARCGDLEVALQVRFGRRLAIDLGISVDEG